MGIYDNKLNSDAPRSGHRYVRIQAQDESGSWVGASQVAIVSPGAIRSEMEAMKRQYPNSRVRALDEDGNFVDFLPQRSFRNQNRSIASVSFLRVSRETGVTTKPV
jgi:hypothetical protein